MRRLFFIILVVFFAACATSPELRYPPERWLSDNDRAEFDFNSLHKKKKTKSQLGTGDTIFQQMGVVLDFSQQISDMPSKATSIGLEALNVNNFDEVADSTWFANRIIRWDGIVAGRGVSEKIRHFEVIAANIVGKSPIFVAEGEYGERYMLKFDSGVNDERATGAEVISSRILHEAGYNVPLYDIIDIRDVKLSVGKSAKVRKNGQEITEFTDKDLKESLGGRNRAAVSLLFEGASIGPFEFQGKRAGDINDRILHEHRRELRGLKVFAAFLNFQSISNANTFDVFISKDEKIGYVSHHLIEFSRTLDNQIPPKTPTRTEHSSRALGNLFSFGFYDPFWTSSLKAQDGGEAGLTQEKFKPDKWQPLYPNLAFKRATKRDCFWAAKILMRFSDKDIEKIVDLAKYTNHEHRDAIIKVLIERRNAITKYWLNEVNPLDNFVLDMKNSSTVITFDDLSVMAGHDNPNDVKYRFYVRTHLGKKDISQWEEISNGPIVLSKDLLGRLLDGHKYYIRIQRMMTLDKWWDHPIDIFIEKGEEIKILGIRRAH